MSDLLTINLDSEAKGQNSTPPTTFLISADAKNEKTGVYFSPKFSVTSLLAQQQKKETLASEISIITPKIDLRNPQKPESAAETKSVDNILDQ